MHLFHSEWLEITCFPLTNADMISLCLAGWGENRFCHDPCWNEVHAAVIFESLALPWLTICVSSQRLTWRLHGQLAKFNEAAYEPSISELSSSSSIQLYYLRKNWGSSPSRVQILWQNLDQGRLWRTPSHVQQRMTTWVSSTSFATIRCMKYTPVMLNHMFLFIRTACLNAKSMSVWCLNLPAALIIAQNLNLSATGKW